MTWNDMKRDVVVEHPFFIKEHLKSDKGRNVPVDTVG